jgi:putative thiamine transport system permease protein
MDAALRRRQLGMEKGAAMGATMGVAWGAAPAATAAVLVLPVIFGLGATVFPAFGYLPALGGNSFSFAPFADLLAEPGLLRSCLVSLFAGLVTTALALVTVAGFIAGWAHTRAFRLIQHLLSPLLSVPHAAAAFGLAFLFAPSGWLLRLASPELTGFTRPPDWLIINDPLGIAMMAGLFAKELPFLFLVTLAALPQVRARPHGAISASLGYGAMAGFLIGVWPRIYPQIRLAVFAVIAYSSSAVDVAIILGPTAPAPLAVRLVQWMNDPDLSMRFHASAGAMLQLGVTLSALLLWIGGERFCGALMRALRVKGHRFRRDGAVRAVFAALALTASAAVFAGLFLLALWSIAGPWNFPDALPQWLTARIWERQMPMLGRPLAITLATGLAATLIAVLLTLACLEGEARTGRRSGGGTLALLYLPLLVPQASFVFGLQLFFLSVGVDASFAALVLGHLVFVLPYVFLSLSNPWHAFDIRYARAALSMGASPGKVFFQLRLPMLLRAVLTAAAVGFAVSVGQYLPTLLIGAGRWPTLATEAVALSSGGDRRVIGVYAFVQLLLPILGFLAATMIPALVHSDRRDMRAAT